MRGIRLRTHSKDEKLLPGIDDFFRTITTDRSFPGGLWSWGLWVAWTTQRWRWGSLHLMWTGCPVFLACIIAVLQTFTNTIQLIPILRYFTRPSQFNWMNQQLVNVNIIIAIISKMISFQVNWLIELFDVNSEFTVGMAMKTNSFSSTGTRNRHWARAIAILRLNDSRNSILINNPSFNCI